MKQTFPYERTDLGGDELLNSVSLPSHQPKNGQKGPDVTQATSLVFQLLPLCRHVDAGEDVSIRVTERTEEGFILGVLPQHLSHIPPKFNFIMLQWF